MVWAFWLPDGHAIEDDQRSRSRLACGSKAAIIDSIAGSGVSGEFVFSYGESIRALWIAVPSIASTSATSEKFAIHAARGLVTATSGSAAALDAGVT